MLPCNVCLHEMDVPLYESADNVSITTMNKVIAGTTRVYLCDVCGHLQTNALPNLAAYYAHEYEINLAGDDDDQLYRVVDGQMIFRADHQAAVLRSKVTFRPGLRVLDYGCAKAQTLRKLLDTFPDIDPFLFDVTDRYVPFWKRLPKQPHWSLHQPDPSWTGSMDLVLSFYALEHVADLHGAIASVTRLLRPDGTFYFVVPNVYANLADFIVADHINHFSKTSLFTLLARAGFGDIQIDDRTHDAAFVVTAKVDNARAPSRSETADLLTARSAARDMARYWRTIGQGIRAFEVEANSGGRLAVYGAGFYGGFVTSALVNPERVRCYVDRNPFLQGTEFQGRPIVSPDELPANITHVLVGLNPNSACAAIKDLDAWASRRLTYFYL